LNTYILLWSESIVAIPDPYLSLALFRDEQRLSLGSLLMDVNINRKLSTYPTYTLNSITKYRYHGLN
jgi:hypothetical protein